MKRKDAKAAKTLITLRIPTSLLEAVEFRASEELRSRSELLRELIGAGMTEWPSTEREIRSIRQELMELRVEVGEVLKRTSGGGR